MITITNRREKTIVKEEELIESEDNYYMNRKDLLIEMEFVIKNGNITMIRKRLGSSENGKGDILKTYVNKIVSNNEVVLNKRDYDEVLHLLDGFRKSEIYGKDVIIDSYSRLLAYECYTNYYVCELYEVDFDDIYEEICCGCCYRYEKYYYKDEILQRVKEVLKKEYKVNLDFVF